MVCKCFTFVTGTSISNESTPGGSGSLFDGTSSPVGDALPDFFVFSFIELIIGGGGGKGLQFPILGGGGGIFFNPATSSSSSIGGGGGVVEISIASSHLITSGCGYSH